MPQILISFSPFKMHLLHAFLPSIKNLLLKLFTLMCKLLSYMKLAHLDFFFHICIGTSCVNCIQYVYCAEIQIVAADE